MCMCVYECPVCVCLCVFECCVYCMHACMHMCPCMCVVCASMYVYGCNVYTLYICVCVCMNSHLTAVLVGRLLLSYDYDYGAKVVVQ